MKSKDQQLLEEVYTKILKEESKKMTPQQEHVYSRYWSTDWEFDRWEGDSIIMKRWDRGSDSASMLAELIIKPDGEHYRLKKEE
jgi:hypothetical protein